jgi:hypothetical protein
MQITYNSAKRTGPNAHSVSYSNRAENYIDTSPVGALFMRLVTEFNNSTSFLNAIKYMFVNTGLYLYTTVPFVRYAFPPLQVQKVTVKIRA